MSERRLAIYLYLGSITGAVSAETAYRYVYHEWNVISEEREPGRP